MELKEVRTACLLNLIKLRSWEHAFKKFFGKEGLPCCDSGHSRQETLPPQTKTG